MKILLLTDIPPCDDFTAGIVLSAMVRFLPRGSICCFAVVNPSIPLRMSPEFSGIPVEFHEKPLENWSWLPETFPFKSLSSFAKLAGDTYISAVQVKSLVAKAVAHGRAQQVDRVWAVLQGQTTIRMALEVAEELHVPLHSQVWDPFSWWARDNRLHKHTTDQVQELFDRTIGASRAVATASHAMARYYRDRFGIKALPVISSYPRTMACTPAPALAAKPGITIGMAGQFYAASEWLQLVAALDAVGWTVGGRQINIIVMGPVRPPAMPAGRVTFLGWKPQAEAVKLLAELDMLYCPYPFDPAMEEVARYSFPSKLVLYLAAGRPILLHGPAYSAVAAYVASTGCGVVVDSLSGKHVLDEIAKLAGDRQGYAEMTSRAQQAFLKDFTLESMAQSFNEFIGAERFGGAEPQDHSRRAGDEPQPDQLSHSLRRSLLSLLIRFGRLVRKVLRGSGKGNT